MAMASALLLLTIHDPHWPLRSMVPGGAYNSTTTSPCSMDHCCKSRRPIRVNLFAVLTFPPKVVECAHVDAGWSSLVARRAHNPKVIGSNPVPATNIQREARSKRIWPFSLLRNGPSSRSSGSALHHPRKVIGSNPVPATHIQREARSKRIWLFFVVLVGKSLHDVHANLISCMTPCILKLAASARMLYSNSS